jgi:hypothetical protein
LVESLGRFVITMSDVKEQIKQRIAIQLENARFWAMILIPSISLVFTIMFSSEYLADNLFAKLAYGLALVEWVLYALYKRNEKLSKAKDLIAKL